MTCSARLGFLGGKPGRVVLFLSFVWLVGFGGESEILGQGGGYFGKAIGSFWVAMGLELKD